jgi:N-acetylglucosaminyl-diphospho-decaprenol L-rhamnosyltransferase
MHMHAPAIDVTIVIVTWNVAEYLDKCLRAILASDGISFEPNSTGFVDEISAEVIVINSGSTDATNEVLSRYTIVRAITLPENVGYTRSANIGLRLARGLSILLLNPDTEISAQSLRISIQYLRERSSVGIVGLQTFGPDGTTQPTARRFPGLLQGLFINGNSNFVWLGKLTPKRIVDQYLIQIQTDNAFESVDWLIGSALLVRRDCYESVGLLDERFWMYFDDADWCKRAKTCGWLVAYLPTATIVHYQGKSSSQNLERRHLEYHRSKIWYFRKHHGWLAATILQVWFLMCGAIDRLAPRPRPPIAESGVELYAD